MHFFCKEMIYCYTNFAHSPLILRTKLDEGPLFVRYRNGGSSSLVPWMMGVKRDLHRTCMGIKVYILMLFFQGLNRFLQQVIIKFAKSIHNTENFCNFVFVFRFINYNI